MSAVYLLGGVVGYLGLLGALTISMILTAKQVARWVGVPEFRWFREPTVRVAWWRSLVVRAAAGVAPLCVAIGLSWASFLINGIPKITTHVEVDVLEGPARRAGLRDGDRIVSLGGEPIANWEQLRAVAHRSQGPTLVVVERAGSRIELLVTPLAGRLAVGPRYNVEKLSAGAALAEGIKLPFAVIRASARSFVELGAGREKAEFQGPVGIVRETSSAQRQGSALTFLAMLAAYLWPFLMGIPLFDAAASRVFRAMHPRAEQSALRGYRLERLRLTLLLAASGYVTVALASALTTAGLPVAVVLLLWAMPAATATYPLIWIAGSEVWSRGVVLLMLGIALFVPCLPLLIILGLLRDLRLALRNEGFSAGWFRAEPV
jgi:hypothetical protein